MVRQCTLWKIQNTSQNEPTGISFISRTSWVMKLAFACGKDPIEVTNLFNNFQ